MSLVEKVALHHFSHSPESELSDAEKVEIEEVQSLNALPLEQFQELPDEVRELAEELWTARVVDANLRRQAERRALVEKELMIEPKERQTLRVSWRD
ncbi:hypothetical protein [Caulobacter sp.]|uniref:hypothetical protein n=1 Tax=Caulobacter sp. TaxID=78 RepID=UPI001B137699|nr:hypothetical protein [Caulobacter sp.]MBO9545429.1 hypothetical protein [Caulobacter sp.]